MIVQHTKLHVLFAWVLLAAVIAGLLLSGQGPGFASAEKQAVDHRAAMADKIRKLPTAEKQKIVAERLYGNNPTPEEIASIYPEEIIIDEVIVAGVPYTLIFMNAHDTRAWEIARTFLPAEVHKAPPAAPTDEQVLQYVRALTEVAHNNFQAVAAKVFEEKKAQFRERYPAHWTDEVVRLSVDAHYDTDSNGEVAPEAQRLYNEYMALSKLGNALEFYISLKGKL